MPDTLHDYWKRSNPVISVSMSRNRCVQAVFGTGLSNTVVGSGSVARSPSMPLYPYGTTVRLGAGGWRAHP